MSRVGSRHAGWRSVSAVLVQLVQLSQSRLLSRAATTTTAAGVGIIIIVAVVVVEVVIVIVVVAITAIAHQTCGRGSHWH